MKRILFIVLAVFVANSFANAQEVGFGFKVGISSTMIIGPSEMDADGNDLEDFNFLTAFHVGGLVGYKFNKYMGVRAEVLFSQKGGGYRFDGPSFQSFTAANGATLHSTGTRSLVLNYTNNYLSLPVLFYAFPIKKIRVGAGFNLGVLLSSSGTGEVIYSGALTNGSPVQEYKLALTHNYFKDEAGQAKSEDEFVEAIVGTQTIPIPSVLGAYYNETTKDGNFFRGFDAGILADIAYRLSGGLEIGARINYSLIDVTNNFYDYAQSESTGTPDFNRVSRSDIDRNLVLMFSVSFGF